MGGTHGAYRARRAEQFLAGVLSVRAVKLKAARSTRGTDAVRVVRGDGGSLWVPCWVPSQNGCLCLLEEGEKIQGTSNCSQSFRQISAFLSDNYTSLSVSSGS